MRFGERLFVLLGTALLVSSCAGKTALDYGKTSTSAAPAVLLEERGPLAQFSDLEVRGGGMTRLSVRVPRTFAGSGRGMVLLAEPFGRTLSFFPVESDREDSLFYAALVGVPFDAAPGERDFQVTIRRMDQETLLLRARLKVVPSDYPAETLSVDPRHVSPDRAALKRIRKENAELAKIYRHSASTRLWSGPFVEPLSSVVTSGYGIRRVYNGEMRSYHQGTDFRAAVGTPIFAAGAGKVVLARHLFYTGNTVIIDHGLGLFTIYAHLNEIQVAAGKLVQRGFQLGLSGMTGRVSGPHLHFGVRLDRIRVDPLELLRVTGLPSGSRSGSQRLLQ